MTNKLEIISIHHGFNPQGFPITNVGLSQKGIYIEAYLTYKDCFEIILRSHYSDNDVSVVVPFEPTDESQLLIHWIEKNHISLIVVPPTFISI